MSSPKPSIAAARGAISPAGSGRSARSAASRVRSNQSFSTIPPAYRQTPAATSATNGSHGVQL